MRQINILTRIQAKNDECTCLGYSDGYTNQCSKRGAQVNMLQALLITSIVQSFMDKGTFLSQRCQL